MAIRPLLPSVRFRSAEPSDEPVHDHGYGFIDTVTPELSIAVRPDARGCGIGTQLLRRLLQRADESYDRVSLSVSAQNPAVRLYQRLGFASVTGDGASITMGRARPAIER